MDGDSNTNNDTRYCIDYLTRQQAPATKRGQRSSPVATAPAVRAWSALQSKAPAAPLSSLIFARRRAACLSTPLPPAALRIISSAKPARTSCGCSLKWSSKHTRVDEYLSREARSTDAAFPRICRLFGRTCSTPPSTPRAPLFRNGSDRSPPFPPSPPFPDIKHADRSLLRRAYLRTASAPPNFAWTASIARAVPISRSAVAQRNRLSNRNGRGSFTSVTAAMPLPLPPCALCPIRLLSHPVSRPVSSGARWRKTMSPLRR